MTIKIAVNGLGRIGRCVVRALFENKKYFKNIELVAINASADIDNNIHFLKYDSTHGKFPFQIKANGENEIIIDNCKVRLFKERDPQKINWNSVDADIILECTGAFKDKKSCSAHIMSGAKKVIISAPAKDDSKTIIYGVNENEITKNDQIISAGSCTTNCLAPVAKALNDSIGIVKGSVTTIHAYTNDQRILDSSHQDLRRSRACGLSMIPTSTGAAKAIGLVIPELQGKLDGIAIRVPVANVSMVDFAFLSEKNTNAEEVKRIIKKASKERPNILGFHEEPLVSIDFNHDPRSSIVDFSQIKIMQENFIKIASWYDNEWAFSMRMLDIANFIG